MRQLCASSSRYALARPGMRQLCQVCVSAYLSARGLHVLKHAPIAKISSARYGLRVLKHALAALALAVQVQ